MRRSILNLLLGVFLASVAVFLMSQYKESGASIPELVKGPDLEVTKIVVANRDLPYGSNILRDYVDYQNWPKDSLPEGSFTSMDSLLKNAEGEEENRFVLRSIVKGEPIFRQKISGFGGKPTLSRKISENKRAFSISINDVSGVAGFLLPGDHVDVMLTRKESNKSSKLVTDVILQNIVVLGIDQLTDETRDKPIVARTATVEVAPVQAQKLALAQQIGTLTLSLRHHHNQAEASVSRVSVSDLSGEVSKPRPGSSSVVGQYINIRRGMDMNSTQISR